MSDSASNASPRLAGSQPGQALRASRPFLIRAWVPWVLLVAFLGLTFRSCRSTDRVTFASVSYTGAGPLKLVTWIEEHKVVVGPEEREALTQLGQEWDFRQDLRAFSKDGKLDPVWLLRWGVTNRSDSSGTRLATFRPVLRNVTNQLGILTGGHSRDVVLGMVHASRLRLSAAQVVCLARVGDKFDKDEYQRELLAPDGIITLADFLVDVRDSGACPGV